MSVDPALAREYVGPYENWIFDIGRAYDHPGLDRADVTLSCVVDLHPDTDSAAVINRAAFETTGFQLPVLWQKPLRIAPAVYVSGNKNADDTFADFQKDFGVFWANTQAPASYRTNLPVRTETLNADWRESPTPPPAGDKGQIVIVALIDDGIPFAHRNFTDATRTGTRIDYCWSQAATKGGHPLLFGQEFSKARIDALYAEYDGDEEAIYRAAGLITQDDPNLRLPLSKAHSHGAHVLDALAGQLPGDTSSEQDRVHIIAVDLPAMVSADTSGFGKDMFLLAGLHYIFERADRIAQQYATDGSHVPLVVNISYGHAAGPHDGTGVLEAAFDEMITARRKEHPTALVMPSGNMFLQSTHAVVNHHHFKKNDPKTVTLDWFVPPGDRTSTYLEIWYPKDVAPDSVSVTLRAPTHAGTPTMHYATPDTPDAAQTTHQLIQHAGRTVGQISTEFYRGRRWRHVVALAPTEVDVDAMPAPAGRWTIQMTEQAGVELPEFTGGVAGGMQLWIQRDEDFGSAGTGARQSYFIDPRNELYDDKGAVRTNDSTYNDALVRRFGTLSGMASSTNTTRVGGYVEQTIAAAPYSCAGALRHQSSGVVSPVGPQVDIAGASERSSAHPGVVGAGTRTGITVALGGTSSAAPQVARAMVEKFLQAPSAAPAEPNYADLLSLSDADAVQVTGITQPQGQERLGKFLVRKPRGIATDDDKTRIDLLTTPRRRAPDI